jgi:hypothetical protein
VALAAITGRTQRDVDESRRGVVSRTKATRSDTTLPLNPRGGLHRFAGRGVSNGIALESVTLHWSYEGCSNPPCCTPAPPRHPIHHCPLTPSARNRMKRGVPEGPPVLTALVRSTSAPDLRRALPAAGSPGLSDLRRALTTVVLLPT